MIALDLLWMKPTYSWLGLILVLSGVPVFFFWHSRAKAVQPGHRSAGELQ